MERDYSAVSEIIEFQPEETLQHVSITIIDDDSIEHIETVELYILADPNVHLSPFPRAEITIKDDDTDTDNRSKSSLPIYPPCSRGVGQPYA